MSSTVAILAAAMLAVAAAAPASPGFCAPPKYTAAVDFTMRQGNFNLFSNGGVILYDNSKQESLVVLEGATLAVSSFNGSAIVDTVAVVTMAFFQQGSKSWTFTVDPATQTATCERGEDKAWSEMCVGDGQTGIIGTPGDALVTHEVSSRDDSSTIRVAFTADKHAPILLRMSGVDPETGFTFGDISYSNVTLAVDPDFFKLPPQCHDDTPAAPHAKAHRAPLAALRALAQHRQL